MQLENPKEQRPSLFQSWNTDVETFIVKIENESKLNHEAHKARATLYRRAQTISSIPVVCLPLIAGAVNEIFYNFEATRYVVGFLLLTSTILNAVAQKLALEKKAEKHHHASLRYKDLVTDIQEHLARSPKARHPPAEVMSQTRGRFDTINQEAPPL